MNEITLTFDQVRRAVEKAVADRGQDYVYERLPEADVCMYDHSGEPGCIVGQVVYNLSPNLFDKLRQAERGLWVDYDDGNSEPSSFGASAVPRHLGLNLPTWTTHFLVDLQSEQDSGATWGVARRVAEERHALNVYGQAHEENAARGDLKA